MIQRGARRFLAVSVLAAAAFSPASARADATADQRAAAQALFDDARKLMADKRYPEACPKLEESQRLDPGLGTLLNLAECQALTGRTASAWANFLEAAYQAKAAGQTKREGTARARAAALEAKLSKLTILAVTSGQKVEIKRDGVVVAASLVGTAVPVDPGEHTVSATAPGKRPWETKITVRSEGHQVSVSVPQLEDVGANLLPESKPPEGKPSEPKPPTDGGPPSEGKPPPDTAPHHPPGTPPDVDTGKGPRTAGVVLAVLGVGGIGAGVAFTVLAKQKLDQSNAPGGCMGNVCSGMYFDLRTQARKDAAVSTGTWIAGGLLASGGISLLIWASTIKSTPPALAPAASFDPRGGGALGVRGSF
jgi:hypothetical protein